MKEIILKVLNKHSLSEDSTDLILNELEVELNKYFLDIVERIVCSNKD